jgi:hypothetical protein
LTYHRKILLALLDSPKITDDEKNLIELALIYHGKDGLRGAFSKITQNWSIVTEGARRSYLTEDGQLRYGVESVWKLPNGNQMIFGSDFDVGPDDKDEDKRFTTPWIERIQDTRPYHPESITDNDVFKRFSLEDELKNRQLKLTRFERQILLLKCKNDLSTKEIAKQLGKRPDDIRRIFYNAKKKMDAWLKEIGIKEILQQGFNGGIQDSFDPHEKVQYDHLLYPPPPFKVVRLPSLWDDEEQNPSPIREWFEADYDQNFLASLVPPDEKKPFCW